MNVSPLSKTGPETFSALKAHDYLEKPTTVELLVHTHLLNSNHFMAQDDSPNANVISMHVVGEGPGAIL